MPSNHSSGSGRIAISFAPSSSNRPSNTNRNQPPSTLGKRQRPRNLLDADSDSDREADTHGKHERITTFGGGEADSKDRKAAASLSIERLPNKDWKAEARRVRQRAGRPSPPRRQSDDSANGLDAELVDQDKPIKWGLSVTKTADRKQGALEADGVQVGQDDNRGNGEGDADRYVKEAEDPDKEAVDALLGKSDEEVRRRKFVIEHDSTPVTEDDAFRRDFRQAPDASTLEDYEAMPVEEFGAALLRGMGWDGKDRGPKVKQVKRRAKNLGLGAKEEKGDEDLGEWDQKGAKKSRPKLDDHRREEEQRKARRDDRRPQSYKEERDRERNRDRQRHRHGDRHHAR